MDEVDPRSFHKEAENFIQAFEILSEAEHNRIDLIWVRHYILCHGLELGLKSYLKLKGKTEKFLRKELGHDLVEIMSSCSEEGLEFTREENEHIKFVSTYYKNKGFEYPEPGMVELPKVEEFNQVVRNLLRRIKNRIKEEG